MHQNEDGFLVKDDGTTTNPMREGVAWIQKDSRRIAFDAMPIRNGKEIVFHALSGNIATGEVKLFYYGVAPAETAFDEALELQYDAMEELEADESLEGELVRTCDIFADFVKDLVEPSH